MTKELSKKISWIQFICAVIVIADHSFDYINYAITKKNTLEEILYFFTLATSRGLTYIAMPVFFMISAFLLFREFDSVQVMQWYKRSIKKRIVSILIPYLLWNTIWTILFIFAGRIGIGNNIDVSITIENILLGVFAAKYNEVFWFMQTLMIYVLLSPVLGVLINKIKSLIILVGLILSIIPNTFGGQIVIFHNFYNVFFWCLGAYIAICTDFCKNHRRKVLQNNCERTKFALKISIFVALLCCITAIECYLILDEVLIANSIITECIHIVPIIVCVVLFFDIMDVVIIRLGEVKWYAHCSFLIYAMHKPIQQLYNKFIAKIFEPSLVAHIINLYGGVIFTLFNVLLAIYIMQMICPRALYVLNGGRGLMIKHKGNQRA